MASQARRLLLAFAAAAGAAVVAAVGVHLLSWVGNLEDRAADLRLAFLQPPAPQSTSIVIVAIDEDTVAQFPYRSPVDRKFLARLLTDIDRLGARAIGIDLLFDQPTESDKDTALRETLRTIKTPLAIAFTRDRAVVNDRQLAFLEETVLPSQRVLATLANDPVDGTIRRVAAEQNNSPHIVRRLAALAGAKAPPQSFEIAWRGKPGALVDAFRIIPAHTVGSLPPETLRDQTVLVGLTLSLTDRHRTPFSMSDPRDEVMMPAVLIHAHALDQLIDRRPPAGLSLMGALALSAAMAFTGSLLVLIRLELFKRVIGMAGVISALWLTALIGYRFGLPMIPLIAPTLACLLAAWAMDFLDGRHERIRRHMVQQALSRCVSPAVAKKLLADPANLAVSARQQEASFIFTDIEGFTTLSEQLQSRRLAELLNEYLEGVCSIVFDHEGTIDKFTGDGIMVMFNAPVAQADHVSRAVRCALSIDRYAQSLRERYARQGIALGVTRIGVHCGTAQIGNFGSHQRIEFTALGDTVNTAARIEEINQTHNTRVCFSSAVVERYPDPFYIEIGEVVLRGKVEPIRLFTHADAIERESIQTQIPAGGGPDRAGRNEG